MPFIKNPDLGKLLLRLTLALLMLFHGADKLLDGIGGVRHLVSAAGLPEIISIGVYVGEVIAPLMLLVGWYSRFAAGLIVINMLFAIGLAHMGDFLSLTPHGGWLLELQAFYLMTALALVFTGPGKYVWRH